MSIVKIEKKPVLKNCYFVSFVLKKTLEIGFCNLLQPLITYYSLPITSAIQPVAIKLSGRWP
ncbi:MAG: hypothetical protein K2W97_08700 [Chthoniobacterales bacterium]|nr:hypothetical protein [Chthoniobacterales bacterium]